MISLSNIRPIIIYFHSSQCRLIPCLHQRSIFFKANSSIVAILELIRSAQCLFEVIRSSGKEMWRVDAYQIPYYSRGIEGEKRTHPRFADCHYIFTVFRLLTDFVCLYTYEFWLSLCKIVRSSVILLLPLSISMTFRITLLSFVCTCVTGRVSIENDMLK